MEHLKDLKIPADLASSSIISTSSAASAGGKHGGNFLNQLESMLGAVKKEAGALESMKAKLKDMEEVKNRLNDLKTRLAARDNENADLRRALQESEQQKAEMRSDMQRLNDIYNSERGKLSELQQTVSRLEQELSGSKLEKDYFLKESQKIPDLKKNVKTLKTQLAAEKKALEEERAAGERKLTEKEKELQATTSAKEEATQHFWNVTNEFNAAKEQIEAEKAAQELLNLQLADAQSVRAQLTDRLFMTREDFRSVRVKKFDMAAEHKKVVASFQSEIQALQFSVNNKKDELEMVHADLKNLQQRHDDDTATKNARLIALEENVRDLTVKNQSLSKEASALKQRMASSGSDSERLQEKLQEAKQKISTLAAQLAQKDADSAAATKSLTIQRDELEYRLQTVTAQLEGLQAGAKSEQSKHWDEVKRLKEAENSLLEETERLNAELQEKAVALHALEASKTSSENSMREEVSETAQLCKSLQAELERRLEELVQMRNERDALALGKEEFVNTIERLKSDISRNEESFKKTLDADRQQVKQELQSRTNRIRSLEAEKHELLSETQGLMAQVSESQQELSVLRTQLEEAQSSARTSSEQLDIVRAHNNDLVRELQAAARQEEEAKETAYKKEGLFREETERMELALRESKKSASQQVLQLNEQIRSLCEEVEQLKRHEFTLVDRERKAGLELERIKSETATQVRQQQEQQQQTEQELADVRRELTEHRGKAKIVLESKTRLEMELINLRVQMDKSESDVAKQAEAIKQQEDKQRALEEKLRASQSAVEAMTETSDKYKATVAELEEAVQRKNGAIDALKEDLVQMERDGLIEVRRLRVQLNASEQEINELRPLIPMLQKEIADGKALVSKLQSNTNGTVNNLLEEVRVAEDALTQERKRNQSEQNALQSRITELQINCDRLKECLEEAGQKSRMDRSERELKMMQVESDLERLKGSLSGKDSRIEELEKQHHQDRVRLHELTDKLESSEREVAGVKSALEHEQVARSRVEGRLRSMLSTPEFLAGGGGGGAGGSSVGGGAALIRTGSNVGDDASVASSSTAINGGDANGCDYYYGAGSGYHSARSARSLSAQSHQGANATSTAGAAAGEDNERGDCGDIYEDDEGGEDGTLGGGGGSSSVATRLGRWTGTGAAAAEDEDLPSTSRSRRDSARKSSLRPYSARTQQLLAAAGNADPLPAVLPAIGHTDSEYSSSGYGQNSIAFTNNGTRFQSSGSRDENNHFTDREINIEASQLRSSQSLQAVPTIQGLQHSSNDRQGSPGGYLSPSRKTPRSLVLQPLEAPAQHPQYQQQHLVYPPSPVVDRVSQALAARAAAESSKTALKQAQQQQQQMLRHSRHTLAAGVTGTGSGSSPHPNPAGNIEDEGAGSGSSAGMTSSVEDSIQRTQMILNRKLQQQQQQQESSGSSKSAALVESITQGRAMYPSASPSRPQQQQRQQQRHNADYEFSTGDDEYNGPGGSSDGEGGMLGNIDISIGAPQLEPAKPPPNKALHNLTAAATAAVDEYYDGNVPAEDNFSADDDGQDELSALNQRQQQQRKVQSKGSTGQSRSQAAAAAASRKGSATSAGVKKTSGSKNAAASNVNTGRRSQGSNFNHGEVGPNYDGLEEALSLPKISAPLTGAPQQQGNLPAAQPQHAASSGRPRR